MKTGFENKRNVAILIVLGLVLAGCIWYFVGKMFGGGPAPSAAAQPATPSATATRETPAERRATTNAQGPAAKKVASLESLDPTLHPELMAGAESLVYAGTGRNIFSMQSAPPRIEQVIGPVRPSTPQAPPPPPGPPPIDLTFFGYQANNGVKKAFLLHGTDVFIASEGDVVDHHYKIDKINPLSIQVTDLLYNNTQTLPLSQS
ncbi:MAG TPA: hypothetical protein VKT75_13540 [Acidobacteriaceae bacterium]|nr:hypothetical protein [Acidobacteriaceae bacterium]